jgi:hypothetical protein
MIAPTMIHPIGARPLGRCRIFGALVVSLVMVACVESGPEVRQIEDARRALDRRDVEARAYQWQLAVLGQAMREAQQRADARERDLFAQVRELAAEKAALTERLKKAESELTSISAAPPADGLGKGGRDDARASAEALRRVIASSDARNAQIVEELARIARVLASNQKQPDATPPKAPPAADVVDPWGFGSRK